MERIGWLREVAVSLERLVAEGIASGAVRGAVDELGSDLSEGEFERTLGDLRALLRRAAEGAGERPPFPPGDWTRLAAEGAVRGGIAEMKRSLPLVDETLKHLLGLVEAWLERVAVEVDLRSETARQPGPRMALAAAGAVRGIVNELESSQPRMEPFAARVASAAGQGFVHGATGALADSLDREGALRRAGRELARDSGQALASTVRTMARRFGQVARAPVAIGAAVAGLAAVSAFAGWWPRR